MKTILSIDVVLGMLQKLQVGLNLETRSSNLTWGRCSVFGISGVLKVQMTWFKLEIFKETTGYNFDEDIQAKMHRLGDEFEARSRIRVVD